MVRWLKVGCVARHVFAGHGVCEAVDQIFIALTDSCLPNVGGELIFLLEEGAKAFFELVRDVVIRVCLLDKYVGTLVFRQLNYFWAGKKSIIRVYGELADLVP